MKFAWGVSASLAIAVAMTPRVEAASITISTKTYAISGTTGKELMESMTRLGPRSGSKIRAMAQTQHNFHRHWKVKSQNGVCRVQSVKMSMTLTYIYPQPSEPLPPNVQRRWSEFMVAVQRHEQQHGAYNQQMVKETERAVLALKTTSDPWCFKTRSLIKTTISEIEDEFKAKHFVFEKKEHRKGGNIERIIAALTK